MSGALSRLLTLMAFLIAPVAALDAEDSPAARRQRSHEFHLRAQQRTGVLVPMYLYPADIHTNPAYNRLMDIKRRFETVPMWVVVNPASGPGKAVDANYSKAIDRLQGAGCMVLGYVTTSYAKRPEADVRKDIDRWLRMYPRIQGIFFDEMGYEDTEAGVGYQANLNRYCARYRLLADGRQPGAETPGRYFAAAAADVIVVHEGDSWPKEERLRGDYFGGYADYPPFTRGVLLYSQAKLDRAGVSDGPEVCQVGVCDRGSVPARRPGGALCRGTYCRSTSRRYAACSQNRDGQL